MNFYSVRNLVLLVYHTLVEGVEGRVRKGCGYEIWSDKSPSRNNETRVGTEEKT